jgi:hypothetical protein
MFDLRRFAAISVQVAYNMSACELPDLKGVRNSERNQVNTNENGDYKYSYLRLDRMAI